MHFADNRAIFPLLQWFSWTLPFRPYLHTQKQVFHCLYFLCDLEWLICLDGCIYTEDMLLYPPADKGVPLRTKDHINVDRNCHLISFRSLSPLAVGQIGPWIKTDKGSFSSILKRKGLERKVTGNDNMFNKTRPQRQALLSHKRQQREAEGESERASAEPYGVR